MKPTLTFKLTDPDELRTFAILTAQWVREGITFEMTNTGRELVVILTGGF